MFAASKTAAVASAANWIEDCFSCYLYTGNGSTQTITNGIDLSGKGGMLWIKSRSAATNNVTLNTINGTNAQYFTNDTVIGNSTTVLDSFNSTGFTLGTNANVNTSAATYVSWTFRKQAKFFDVVTYTGTGVNRTIPHNLGSVPGCIIVKKTSSADRWEVYHRSLTSAAYALVLNSTAAQTSQPTDWNSTAPTATEFSVGTSSNTNSNGASYVAYLFAHDAGGFGATGADNVISCGSFTTDGSGAATMTLNYEPQFIIIKNSSSAENWVTLDNMRGWTNGSGGEAVLSPNLSNAESAGNYGNLTSTGATWANLTASKTYIYIAIRRGPMRTPTSGTSVFELSALTPSTNTVRTTTVAADMLLAGFRTGASGAAWSDRVRGFSAADTQTTPTLASNSSVPETTSYGLEYAVANNTATDGRYANGFSIVKYRFKRAPGFFDVVCYTGTGSNRTVSHNLAAVPELMIMKRRSAGAISWAVYASALGNNGGLELNTNGAAFTGATTYWNSTTPTSSVFTVGTDASVNTSSSTYVAYLFATVSGVSKVGSYTGTGATQTIDCGFSSGARFVLIKRTDSTGDWYVWDTARGMVSGTDPSLLLNSTAAEVNANSVYTTSVGFQIVSTAAGINASGGAYIFLAIA